MTSRRTDRIARASALRTAGLELLRRSGRWTDVDGFPGKVRAYEGHGFSMLHRSRFQPVPASKEMVATGISAARQRDMHGDFGLDIWSAGRKVLSLVWDGDGEPRIVSFRRGQWENEFLSVGSPNER